jgi:flagellar biosynthesis protein FlhF
MRIKLYRAASMAGAMAQLREELGPDALILSSRRVGDGVELTAGVESAEEPPPPAAVPRPAAAPSRRPHFDPAYHAVPHALAEALAGPDLAERLRAALRFGPLPLQTSGLGGPLMLVGTPGAGKTLSAARLATRLVLGGIQPLVITADGRRAGGAEELAAYTRLLGLTLLAASTPATIPRALAQAARGVPVLIDSAGVNPFDPADMDALATLVEAASAVCVLVLQAGAHPEEAAEQAACFARVGVRHVLPTRLDIARRLGSVLSVAQCGFILTEAGVGTGATDGLVPITPEFLASRLAQPSSAASPARQAAPHAASGGGPRLSAPVFPQARARAAAFWPQPMDMRHNA